MRKTLITGFALFIPLALTLYFVVFTIEIAALPFKKIASQLLSKELLSPYFAEKHHQAIQKIAAELMAIILLLLASFVLGFLARFTLKKYLIDAPLEWIKQLPFIGPFIRLTADVSERVLNTEKLFKETALVPFIGEKRYVVGLVTSQEIPLFCPEGLQLNRTVFVPTSPHPVSGFLILTEEEEIIKINMNTNDAFALVISCGASTK